MSSSYRRQAMIEAPVEVVWELIGDPNRHPEWFPIVMQVSGLPVIEHDATFRQVTRSFGGQLQTTTMAIEDIEDLRQISLRCRDTGTFTRWWLQEAQGATFVEMEFGLDPTGMMVRLFDATLGGRYCRRWTEDALDGLKQAVTSPSPSGA